ncbi:uncharacterized protein LOC112568122 isoform X2 [Pomacea canaliculata]|uniref:uncharacterized protein LOC112568122 isoform X2 n=1 Tax=Pomacea canaliculata TaxID=400727 RepID=UPI000D72BE1D|nr:uncharacterized protein LOC112568122 isoform X2 [Pomacea canaliculata]
MSAESSGRPRKVSSSRKSQHPPRLHYPLGVPPDKCGLVIGTGDQNLNEIKRVSGASVRLVDSVTLGCGLREFRISGRPIQIRQAIRLIYEKTGGEKIIKEKAQDFWKYWVSEAYPDFQSQAYFLPAVFINRVPRVKWRLEGQDINLLTLQPQAPPVFQSRYLPGTGATGEVPQPPRVQDSDIAKDAALERVLMCLHKMAEVHNEVFMALSQLHFVDYLGDFAYAEACALMPTVANLSPTRRQGTFDLLLIHKLYGLVLCEVKATSGNISGQEIGKKLRTAVSQLDKAQVVLTHLVSDIAPGIRVTKVIALPNLTERRMKTILATDLDLTKLLSHCLGLVDSDVINGLICSDRLPPSEAPWDVNKYVLQEFWDWWQFHVACLEPDSVMTAEVYENIVARFCGPATTVTVPCTSTPRLTVKTLGQAVSKTGVYFSQLTLFPEQVDLIHSKELRVFLAGPPGTGKTVVLQLVALKWLRHNHDVYVMSTTEHSRMACCMLHHLLQHELERMRQAGEECGQCGQLHLLQYNFRGGTDVDRATQELTDAAKNGEVYVIADEVGPDDVQPEKDFRAVSKTHFHSFCENLRRFVQDTHLWAASCKHKVAPKGWKLEYFTRPLRSPPTVVREVERSEEMGSLVRSYESRGLPYPTQGPDVKWIHHERPTHPAEFPVDCQRCGEEVAIFLKGLRVGDQDNLVTDVPDCVQHRHQQQQQQQVNKRQQL